MTEWRGNDGIKVTHRRKATRAAQGAPRGARRVLCDTSLRAAEESCL